MNQILEWIKAVVIFQLFSIIFLGLFPKGKYDKYMELLVSFVLMMILLEPLRLQVSWDRIFEKNYLISQYKQKYGCKEDIEPMISGYGSMVEGQIENILKNYGYEAEVTTVVKEEKGEYQIQKIRIDIKKRIKENYSDKVMETFEGNDSLTGILTQVAQTYGVEEENIQININQSQNNF